MFGQLGAWDEGLGIAVDGATAEWLGNQGTDMYVSVHTEGRRIFISPNDGHDGKDRRRRVANRGAGAHVDFKRGATFEWPLVIDWAKLPRFALFEVKLHFGNEGLYLWADLPADHLLPWPKLRDCRSYDVPSQIAMDLEQRMLSAKAAHPGVPPSKWHWEPMPEKFRSRLARGVYGDCLKCVIAGLPYTMPERS